MQFQIIYDYYIDLYILVLIAMNFANLATTKSFSHSIAAYVLTDIKALTKKTEEC